MIIESIHNASYTCPFIQIERINHITRLFVLTMVYINFINSTPSSFFSKETSSSVIRGSKSITALCDVIPHLRYHFRIHHLKSILTEWTTIVIAVHLFAGRRTQQNIQALLDILLIRHHLYTVFCQRRRKVPTFSQKAIIVQYIILFAHTLHPPIITVGHPATIVPPCAVLSPYEPQVCHLSLQWMNLLLLYPVVPRRRTCHLRRLPVFSLSKHSAHLVRLSAAHAVSARETPGVCMGQVCISVILAAEA